MSPIKIADVRFAMNLCKSVRFAFNAMNAAKKKLLSGEKIAPIPAECGEKKFQPYQQNAVKKNHRYQQNAMKKNLPLKSQILQIFTALILKLIISSQEVSMQSVTDGAVEEKFDDIQEVRGSNQCTGVPFL